MSARLLSFHVRLSVAPLKPSSVYLTAIPLSGFHVRLSVAPLKLSDIWKLSSPVYAVSTFG